MGFCLNIVSCFFGICYFYYYDKICITVFTILMCTIQWHKVYSQCYAATTIISRLFITLKENPIP